MERPGRNLIAVTVVTLGVWFLSFFLQAASFYLFIYCYRLHFFKIGG